MLTYLLLNSCLSVLLWNFNADTLGKVPSGWELRGARSPKPIYSIQEETAGNRFLAARSEGSDVQLGLELLAKPQTMPMLTWRWRVLELPRNADERNLSTLDSAASVYAVFGSRLFPRILKYVWSTSVPASASFKHPASGRMTIIVVNSGAGALGQWQSVSRDLVEDYSRAFGSTPDNLIAIGVKTDSDSTHSTAQADYDDIQLAEVSALAPKEKPCSIKR
jgi:hypothetical protein